MKRISFLVLCTLLLVSVSILAVSAMSDEELSDVVELALSDSFSMRGGSGGGRGGGGRSSSGGRSGGRSSSSGGSRRGGSARGNSMSGGSRTRGGKRGSSKPSSLSGGSRTRGGKRGGRVSGPARSPTSKTTQKTSRVANTKNIAAAYKQYANSRLSKASPKTSRLAAAPKTVSTKALAAAYKQMAQSKVMSARFAAQPQVASQKLTPNAIRASYQQQMAKNMVGKLSNLAKAVANTPIGKVVTSKYQQVAKAYQTVQQQKPAYKVDKNLINVNEAFKTKGYVPSAGVSGVTVGTGFDIGQNSKKDLQKLGLSPSLVDKLSPYTGLKRQQAVNALAKNPLSVTVDEAKAIDKAVFDKSVKSLATAYEAAVKGKPKAVQKFSELPAAVQTVAYSVHHQYGSLKKTPDFFDKLSNNNYKGMVSSLRNFKDAYPTRRNREADYMEKNMK